ncbi:GFA family protein [Luteimonas sp. BDR2-5]|uniref:GFA family protein n=1 Tax=Proluteimonas luteida TaxID=2878685 RepID=UPI001E5DC63E|nr:GFA family protein [Luteimonas sp. BDR2-5]MCD9029972.1 GFA family protein [Luteimonas sp. BDR2-5]
MHCGSCLCGDVRFEVAAELAAPDACHCVACRKSSGHVFASTDVPVEALTIHDPQAALCWYASSERVRRGFCGRCGASLFWAPVGGAKIAVAMGAFDTPTGTHLHMHIFVSEQGDYYVIDDGLPQHAR